MPADPDLHPGSPSPLGATWGAACTNFAVFSRHAREVVLEFYASATDAVPHRRIALYRTGDVWHVGVAGLPPGQIYAYRADGDWRPHDGLRFNPRALLLDPYARGLAGDFDWGGGILWNRAPGDPPDDLRRGTRDSTPGMPRCVLMADDFDWQGDARPRVPWEKTILYEVHVRGYTRHESAGVRHPGTYAALTEKIPHLRALGITAVELLPVQEFPIFQHRRTMSPEESPDNFWGYNTAAFFTPQRGYALMPESPRAVREFKEMVRAFHAAGIEVIIDVVFNHTAESDELGPTFCWRGLDNRVCYMLEGGRLYQNHSGCGNTLNVSHPAMRRFILDCLDYWTGEMHVDGFRFDLAAVFFRREDGAPADDAPLPSEILQWARRRGVKIIAEPWDASGLYRLGGFPEAWREWNGRYRDDVRRFWRGDEAMTRHLATRLMGSSDTFAGARGPLHSINFVTCHDGFTLWDMVSYAQRHNEANGDDNRDGEANNHSHNWGVEGETADPAVNALRRRLTRSIVATLLLSRGVPMLLGGDEFRRTQGGNNNAYCQDNETSWVDWAHGAAHAGFAEFVARLIDFRARHPLLFGAIPPGEADLDFCVEWFDAALHTPPWNDPSLRHLALWQYVRQGDCRRRTESVLMLFNASPGEVAQRLPGSFQGTRWYRVMDTAHEDAEAFLSSDAPLAVEGDSYPLAGHAMALLIER